MKLKSFLLFFLILLVFFAAVFLHSGGSAIPPSSPSSQPLLSWDDRVLSGLPWPEELTLSLPEEKIFDGLPLPELEPPLLTLLGNLGESSVDHALKGTVPTVAGAVYDLPGVGMVNLAHLQVFSREEFDAPDRYIKAGEDLRPCGEMEAYVIYRDERYVVLDMTGFVITRPFPEILAEAQTSQSGDLSYLQAAWDWCRGNLSGAIS